MHYDIECFYNNTEVQNDSTEFNISSNFEDYKQLKPYRTEWMQNFTKSKSFILLYGMDRTEPTNTIETLSIEHSNFGKYATTIVYPFSDTNYWHCTTIEYL